MARHRVKRVGKTDLAERRNSRISRAMTKGLSTSALSAGRFEHFPWLDTPAFIRQRERERAFLRGVIGTRDWPRSAYKRGFVRGVD